MENVVTGGDPLGGEGSGLEEGKSHPLVQSPVVGDGVDRDDDVEGGGRESGSGESPPENPEAEKVVPEGGAGGDEPDGDDRKDGGEFRLVNPSEILPSPFDGSVNPSATAAEDEALERSIAEFGVYNPLLCEPNEAGQLRVLAGTRRRRFAIKHKKPFVPVRIVRFATREEAKQFAVRDNVQRRHLSVAAKALLGLLFWQSLEKGRNGENRGVSPRRQAASEVGVGEMTLANLKFVLDSGHQDLIVALKKDEITVDAAYKEAKSRVAGVVKAEVKKKRAVRGAKALVALKAITDALETASSVAEQLVAYVPKSVSKGNQNDRERSRKKLAPAREVLEKIHADDTVIKLLDTVKKIEAELR